MITSKTTKEFERAYKALNPEQKRAVDTIEGPVMVVAGPGTGKTQTIALRIANILLKTDTSPDSILALTFTESAAREMQVRLAQCIGHTAYYVNIKTFHGFCVDVIRDNPDRFTIQSAAEPLSELNKFKLFHEFLEKRRWKIIRPINAPHHYVRGLITAVQDLKREAIEPGELVKVLDKEELELSSDSEDPAARERRGKKTEFAKIKRNLAKNRELVEIYRLYEAALRKNKHFDFEDMIGHVTRVFEQDHDLLHTYQERFQYFLVDEYQDTNSAQNKVVELLASHWGEQANVFVVGDPDQSIYRFQGASIENMLSFVRSFPGGTVITLRDNYRSTQSILDAAHSLISHNELRIEDVVASLDPHLRGTKTKDKCIEIVECVSSLSEDIYIAKSIKELLKHGVSPDEIAVIYRNNADAPALARTLAKFDVDYTVQGGGNILAEPVVSKFLKILRVIDEMRDCRDDPNLFTILHYDIFGIDPLDVLKISRLATDKRMTLFDVINRGELLESLDLTTKDKVQGVLASLAAWQDIDANATFVQFFETVLSDSGYLKVVLEGQDVENNIAALNALFGEVKKMNTTDHKLNLHSFLTNLDLMEENSMRIEGLEAGRRKSAITLTTAHSAKGLEWTHVFVYKCYDTLWGNKRNIDLFNLPSALLPNTDISKKEKNEDERRLFYVALTRAKKRLYLTRSVSYSLYGRAREVAPSMFLFELGDIPTTKLSPSTDEEMVKNMERLLTPQKTSYKSQEASAFLKSLVETFALSATSLSSYLTCPYHFMLHQLLRVPRVKEPYMAYGTAVHAGLETWYRQFKETGVKPSKQFLLKKFDLALAKEVLTREEESHRRKQGHTTLEGYYDFFQHEFTAPLFLEKSFRVHLGNNILTGKVDRIDWLNQEDRTVRVVDYKTGTLKTKGQIMGTTADSRGELHRQLVFYKLLLELDPRLRVRFGDAELDFVQAPADKGKSGKVRLSISDDEVRELKETIHHVMGAIRALHFPRTDNPADCQFCLSGEY